MHAHRAFQLSAWLRLRQILCQALGLDRLSSYISRLRARGFARKRATGRTSKMSTIPSSIASSNNLLVTADLAWPEDDRDFRSTVNSLMAPLPIEFHGELVTLLELFEAQELDRFVEIWEGIPGPMRTPFIAFIVSGDDPSGRFLRHLDQSAECREAVDLAFTANMRCLSDFDRSLDQAKAVLSKSVGREVELESALHKAEEAEALLENLEPSSASQQLRKASELVADAAKALRLFCRHAAKMPGIRS